MARLGGYAGNILCVNLSDGRVERRPLSEELVRNFVGGEAINAQLSFELIQPGIDPLSPENVLTFGAGPFIGTMIPTASRGIVTAKSPLTGLFGTSSNGQFWMMKFAGYDHLLIQGKSARPVYLKICDDEVELCDASGLWGKDVWESTDILWQGLGRDYNVATIGPAGESMDRDASIVNNRFSTFARTGLGAVMGSKRLKAIAVKGTRGVEVADGKRLKGLIDSLYAGLKKEGEWWQVPGSSLSDFRRWQALGTLNFLEMFVQSDMVPYKNFQGWLPHDQLEVFNAGVFLSRMKGGDVACLACPVGCKHLLEVREGKYAGLSFPASCVAAIIMSFGGMCGIQSFDEAIKCAELCCRYGMDNISTGNKVAFAMELYERGLIDKDDTGGLDLKWGAAEAAQELIRKIAFREGFGDILADGLVAASRRIGRDAEQYALHVKRLGLCLDARAQFIPETFGNFTNNRGAHPFNATVALIQGDPDRLRCYCRQVGVPQEAEGRVLAGPQFYNVARLTKWGEDYNALLEILGLCKHPALFYHFDINRLADLYTALTGIALSPGELRRAGERSWNLQKAFNLREGATKGDDMAPRRFLTEPLRAEGREKGPLGQEEMDRSLAEYYEERGWDPERGVPTRDKLSELGLEKVAGAFGST